MQSEIRIIPIYTIQEIKQGDNLAQVIDKALEVQSLSLEDEDIIVVTQKIVSKAEGRMVNLATVTPSAFARSFAKEYNKDPRYVELVLSESKRIVRMDHGVIISETKHGYICANAGIDASNIARANYATLLPKNPDASARAILQAIQKKSGVRLAVIITDTWGRPWREGQVNFAIGASGMNALKDYRGKPDTSGYEMQVSLIAVADEIASAAELVMGKINAVPVAIIRGYTFTASDFDAKALLRDASLDMFR